MKFTKEQVVEKLNQELTNNGKKPLRMSAKTLESQVDTLLAFVTDDEMELDAFVEKIKPSMASINSNIEHDNSDFVKQYEQTHKVTQPAPAPADPPIKGGSDNTNADLLRRLEELEARETARQEATALGTKRNEIAKYLRDNNVRDDRWIDSVLGIATIGKDDDVEERGKTFLSLYNQSLQGGSPVTPGATSPSGGVSADSFAEVKALRKMREEIK